MAKIIAFGSGGRDSVVLMAFLQYGTTNVKPVEGH
jgi:hypothetical protein